MTRLSRWLIPQITVTLINISRVLSECTSVDTLPPIDGMACQPFEYGNITASNLEFCSLACVQKRQCEATIYDRTSGVCMLMNYPCFSLKPQFNHVYRSFRYGCTKWINDGKSLAYWYIEDYYRSYVSRKNFEGNVIIGKTTDVFYAIDPNGSSWVVGGSFEWLVVAPRCSVTWVQHDLTSGQSLPREALIGGILTDTNTPLYVARLNISGVLISGYYNPLNGKAWALYHGTHGKTLFEVMVVNTL